MQPFGGRRRVLALRGDALIRASRPAQFTVGFLACFRPRHNGVCWTAALALGDTLEWGVAALWNLQNTKGVKHLLGTKSTVRAALVAVSVGEAVF